MTIIFQGENYLSSDLIFPLPLLTLHQRENTGPALGLTAEEREMFIAGEDLKDEEEDNNFDDHNNDCDPRDLNSKFCLQNAISILSVYGS